MVNETVDEITGEMRVTPFSRYLGDNTIDICFDAAAKAAPHAKLVYNDYMGWGPGSALPPRWGAETAGAAESQQGAGASSGIQSHIGPGTNPESQGPNTFTAADQAAWKQFLDAAVGMNLRLCLTEFDVSERGTPADIAERDRFMADLTRRYLDFMFAYPQTDYLMAWGMQDQYSWLQRFGGARPDGMAKTAVAL